MPTLQSVVNGSIRGSFVMIHGSKNVFPIIPVFFRESSYCVSHSEQCFISFEAVNNFEGTDVGVVG